MRSDTVEKKRQQEERTVSRMIRIYCHAKHQTKTGLCPACRELAKYIESRSRHCPRMESKTFCSSCRIHCYRPEMRERIREVMRFSGPRMLFSDPVMVLRHMCETWKQKRRQKHAD